MSATSKSTSDAPSTSDENGNNGIFGKMGKMVGKAAEKVSHTVRHLNDKPWVLVTGASGFLGTHVVKVFQEDGYKVRATVRRLSEKWKYEHLTSLCELSEYIHAVQIVEVDLNIPDGWHKVVRGCKYVIHTASPVPLNNPKYEVEVVYPAVNGTITVLEAIVAVGGVQRVVMTSSILAIAEYGGNPVPLTEKSWARPDFPNISAFHKSKILAEKAAWEFVANLPVWKRFELAMVNPAMLAGPTIHSTSSSSMAPVRRLLKRDFPAVPRYCLPVCDVRDVAEAHLRCMLLPQAKDNRHIICSGSIWLHQLAQLLDKEFRPQGYNVPTTQIHGAVVWLYSQFDKEIRMTRNFCSHEVKLDTFRMKKVLKIDPYTIQETYLDMAYSMIENNFIYGSSSYKKWRYPFRLFN